MPKNKNLLITYGKFVEKVTLSIGRELKMSYNGWSSHQAWELSLVLENDRQAYENMWNIYKNYEKRIKKGTFNESMAIKGLVGWIDAWQGKLRKMGYYTYLTTPMSIKVEVAKAKLDDFYEEMRYKGVLK